MEAGRSLSEEAERRLENSLAIEERYGGRVASRLFQIMAQTTLLIEEKNQEAGLGHWYETATGYAAVRGAWDAILDKLAPDMDENLPLGHLSLARSIGKDIGDLRMAAFGLDMPKGEPEAKPKARKRQKKS